ncbi:MAG: hypothetical protein PHV95_09035 [Eubacteriales bacterium]|nr:hypothetical protein [Eubacteriales bacterium]MDD4475912.1 hypothetical protein [Eubacteriales bacterium]
MNYVKYNRSFVMMEEQNTQFAAKESAEIKAYLKVETGNNKGAFRCSVQNLKYFEKGDYIYKLILFGKKGERTIHAVIGNLLINKYGNGESYFRFLPLNMDGKGNPYNNFTTAIIAAASTIDEKEPLHPVLKGVTLNEEEPFQPEPFRLDEDIEEDIEEADASDLIEAASPQEKKIEKKTYNNFYNEYVLNACIHTCQIAEFYEDVTPFDKDKTGARWKKMVNITNLPIVSPGAHYFATQYRHYIFGAKADDSGIAARFFFGIPGRFLDEEQPDGGKSGFTYWQPLRGTSLAGEENRKRDQSARNAYGYWIVAIDSKTGDLEEV